MVNKKMSTSKRKRFLLSLDGGGVRGGITCSFLNELEKNLFAPRRETIQTVFHAMGGSSAGAVTSTLLAMGTPISKISSELFSAQEMQCTFKKTWLSRVPLLGSLFQQYQNQSKYDQIQRFLGNAHVDMTNLNTKLLINCFNWTRQSVSLFHNFHPIGLPQVHLAGLVHASSCPPYYLSLIHI